MLNQIIPYLTAIGLALVGAAIGAMVNFAIYAWAEFRERPISPWQAPGQGESPRQTADYYPIVGWWGRRRDSAVLGRGFWIRPLLIEAVWMIGLPAFYFWLSSGNWTYEIPPATHQLWTWFLFYSVWLALLFVATFIDFDEKMIPDQITIPGTLLALGVAACCPWSRLPEYIAGGLAGPRLQAVDYLSPTGSADGSATIGQLGWALAIFAIWIWALLPKLSPWYAGWNNSIRMMYAHAFRPKRKTKCAVRERDRSTPPYTIMLCVLLVVGLVVILAAWLLLSDQAWQSLYGSLLGLAFGGGLIWAIRVIGTFALQQEAMGFGDVTLMAMIGATLGWQATLLAFVYAIVVVVVFLVIQVLATGNQELAFGPYLCAGAVVLLLRWDATWPAAATGLFQLGPVLLYILGGSMILMAAMLFAVQWMKGLFGE